MRIYEITEINEATGLPGDPSTLLSLLSEMINMLGAGSPNRDEGPLRAAIMQMYNNGSAADGAAFQKQINFRTGSIRAMWMGKNWPQLKSCFLRLKKNPKYQRSIAALDALGNWPMMLIKDEHTPTLGKYFNAILSASPSVLKDMARLEPEEHVRQRSQHMASLIPQRVSDYHRFVDHWIQDYEGVPEPTKQAPKPKDEIKGKQASVSQSIVDQVLNAIPPNLAKQLRPQVQRMGSQNERMMFLMKELQKAGIDPNKVLG